jgi:hypothetical protein
MPKEKNLIGKEKKGQVKIRVERTQIGFVAPTEDAKCRLLMPSVRY